MFKLGDKLRPIRKHKEDLSDFSVTNIVEVITANYKGISHFTYDLEVKIIDGTMRYKGELRHTLFVSSYCFELVNKNKAYEIF